MTSQEVNFHPYWSTSLYSLTNPDFFVYQNICFVLKAKNEVCFENRPVPAIENATDVLVRIHVTGISSSDVSFPCDWKPPSLISMLLTHAKNRCTTGSMATLETVSSQPP